MKRADRILEQHENGLPRQSWTSRTPTGESIDSLPVAEPASTASSISNETKTLINALFARFMSIYGHKFKSAFETEDELRIAKREWALSLSGFSERELVQAVNHCKENLSWMPSIADFLKILRQYTSDLGVPDLRAAYQEACLHAHHPSVHAWSHPLVYWSGRQVGWFELRNQTEAETFGPFEYQYQLNIRKLREGDSLEVPNPLALEQKSELTQATQMLAFAKEHQLDESVACQMLFYLTLPVGSRSRARHYTRAKQQAETLGLALPTAQ